MNPLMELQMRLSGMLFATFSGQVSQPRCDDIAAGAVNLVIQQFPQLMPAAPPGAQAAPQSPAGAGAGS